MDMRPWPLLAILTMAFAGCAMPTPTGDGASAPAVTAPEDLSLETFLPTRGEFDGFTLAGPEALAGLPARWQVQPNPTHGARLAPWNPLVGFHDAFAEDDADKDGDGRDDELAMSEARFVEATLAAIYADGQGRFLLIEVVQFPGEAPAGWPDTGSGEWADVAASMWAMWYHPCEEDGWGPTSWPTLAGHGFGASYVVFSADRQSQGEAAWRASVADARAAGDHVRARTGTDEGCDVERPDRGFEEPNDDRADAWSADSTPSFEALTLANRDDVDWFVFDVGESPFVVSLSAAWGDLELHLEDEAGRVLAAAVASSTRDGGDGLDCGIEAPPGRYYVRVSTADEAAQWGYYSFFVNEGYDYGDPCPAT